MAKTKIKIEDWQIKKAGELAKQGVTKENICIAVNVNVRTYYVLKSRHFKGELNRTAKIEKKAIEFIQAMENGYCDYFTTMEQVVYTGGLEDSKMALEILARRKPKEWGRKDYQKIDARVKTKINEKDQAELKKEIIDTLLSDKEIMEEINKMNE